MLAISGLTSTTGAQSVKDIMGDRTGAYIYAQATDVSADDALSRAAEELSARVDTYIGANKLKTVNGAWREWIKRIINEKYGRTRVFLYLSVSDLDAPPRHNPDDAPLQAGMASQQAGLAAQEASLEQQEAGLQAQEAQIQAQEDIIMAQNEAIQEQYDAMAEADARKAEADEIMAESSGKPETEETAAAPTDTSVLAEGPLADLILKIVTGKDVTSLLAKAKNMRVISLYGNTDSKYMPHAYLVYDDGGTTRVYSPLRKDGTRLSFPDGTSVSSPAGRLVAWFLKK